jgi:predicted esterase
MEAAMESSEHHIRVARTARYRVVGDPGSAAEVWFVLHGYRQLAERFIQRFGALPGAGSRRAVVAPEALSRFYVEEEVGPHGPEARVGAAWMTRADREHEIADYVEYLDRVAEEVVPGEGSGPRIVVLGFSQGAETASRWVCRGRVRPAELVLWGGGLAVDLGAEEVRRGLEGVAVRLVVGASDPWAARRSGETASQLEAAGRSGERLEYPGGHRVEAEALRRHWP